MIDAYQSTKSFTEVEQLGRQQEHVLFKKALHGTALTWGIHHGFSPHNKRASLGSVL